MIKSTFSSDDFLLMLDEQVVGKNHSFLDLLGSTVIKSDQFKNYRVICPGGAWMRMESAIVLQMWKERARSRHVS